MASALTGDYDSVLQVSGSTINRLVAALHRNAFSDSERPSVPHAVSLRIGDPTPIRGHRGWVQAQIGVPRVELVHGSTDRFFLHVAVRARYRGDAGSRALPEFINGMVRAQFRVEDIDPNCIGWRDRADDHVWVRVVRGSVSFDGTAVDDAAFAIAVIEESDPAEVNGRIGRLVEHLLMTRFEANPHRVGRDFRRTWLRSLVAGGESGVTIPVEFDRPPAGRLSSLGELFLDGRDAAVAISPEAIVRAANAELAGLIRKHGTVHLHHNTNVGIDLLNVDIGWNVHVTSAWVEWAGGYSMFGVSVGLLTLHFAVWLDTEKNAFDLTVSATQTLTVGFDPSNQSLVIGPAGTPKAAVDASSALGPLEWIIETYAPPEIAKRLTGIFPTQTIFVDGYTSFLDGKLDKLAKGAKARFDTAQFGDDGMVLRGTVSVTAPARPTVGFVKAPEGDGFSALEAWIPGGIIDRFEWSWSFPEGTTGDAKRTDRWLLRRPAAKRQGRFNAAIAGRSPLPGIDRSGRLCLTIRGRYVDPVTGALAPVTSHKVCKGYGVWFATSVDEGLGRPDLRDVPELATDVPFPQLGVRDALLPAGTAGSNTLVVLTGDDFDEATSTALLEGLAHVERTDAGLTVLLLFPDGALTVDRIQDATARLAPKLQRLGVALTVNEDVGGSWSSVLGVDRQAVPSWRLLSPRGGTTWTHDGRADPELLAWGIGECLIPSGPPIIAEADPWVQAITTIDVYEAAFGAARDVRSKCPPFPLRDSIEAGMTVAFVRAASAASERALSGLTEAASSAHPFAAPPASTVVVVVDGGDQTAADDVAGHLGTDAIVLADPDGHIGSRLGVRIWPTIVRTPPRRNEVSIVSEAPSQSDRAATRAT